MDEPVLQGTEKRIAWATDVRSKLGPAIAERIVKLEQHQAARAPALATRPTNAALAGDLEFTREELQYLRAFLASPRADLWIAHARCRAADVWSGRCVGTAAKYGLLQSPGWEAR